jgi:hypothetical protein
MKRGEIKLYNETMADLSNYLLTRGVPLPPGAVRNPAGVRVVNAKGKVLASAGKVLQKRPDGSIEWLLMDILTPLSGQEKTSIFVEPSPGKQPTVKNPVKLVKQGRQLTLTNGLSAVTVSGEGGTLVRKLIVNGRTIVGEGMLVDLECVDAGGKIHRASLSGAYRVSVPHQNPLRTVVMLTGKHQARDGATFMDFALRFTLTANSPDVKIEHTFYCREPRDGKICIRSMKLVMPTTMNGDATKLLRQNTRGYDCVCQDLEVKENAEIVASGTGDLDNYKDPGAGVAHQVAGGAVFLRNPDSFHENWSEYPFQMRPGQSSGFRTWHASVGMRHVLPVVGWKQKDFTLVTAFEHFRQLHPKAIDIDESLIAWSIWPAWSSPMQVVQGVSKSHSFWITGEKRALNMDDVIDVLYRWEYGYVEPVDVSFDLAWPAFCEVLDCQHFLKHQPEKYPLLENLIEVAPAAGNPGRHTYDRMPATGMFNFGDNVGGGIAGSTDTGTCDNNEDDCRVLFPLQQFLRTGHTYCWDFGKEMSRHHMEVDFCEWSTEDRRRGGLIAHTGGHFIGCVYPSHQWAEGLLAYYYMSGDERAKRAVIGCGDNNVWWAYNKTELTCCDGREAGMPLVNLAAAYRLTRDEKYIKAAKHIIENFFHKWMKKYGTFKYPYPQSWQKVPHKLITGYGDWSSFAGLYRLWEVTGEEEFRTLGVKMLKDSIKPGSFSLNDIRGMDFFAAWALGRMTGDMDDVFERVAAAVPMLLRRGGHPLRRLHFLKEMDERGLIDEKQVGNRAGVI